MPSRRRLILMRHAKSSWKSDAQTDHDRPLNKRGRRDAPRVAARLIELDWGPQLILSSDATRTQQTVEGMAAQLCDDIGVTFSRRLYHAGIEAVRDAVVDLPDEIETVMVLGHNPGWEEALAWLSDSREILKTACAALLEGEAESWAAAVAAPGGFHLETIIKPREL